MKTLLKIIAIGGGHIGRPGRRSETAAIDRELIRLSGKRAPRLLFVPTASRDNADYIDIAKYAFGKIGCRVDTLELYRRPSAQTIRKKITAADIIYVGGGNTKRMLALWKKYGVDTLMRQAAEKGTVLAGLSAGSLCWFSGGISDWKKDTNPRAPFAYLNCLGVLPFLHSPHFDSEPGRQPALKKILRQRDDSAIALDDCAALEVVGNTYRVLTSKRGARAHLLYWQGKTFVRRTIPKRTNFRPLAELTAPKPAPTSRQK